MKHSELRANYWFQTTRATKWAVALALLCFAFVAFVSARPTEPLTVSFLVVPLTLLSLCAGQVFVLHRFSKCEFDMTGAVVFGLAFVAIGSVALTHWPLRLMFSFLRPVFDGALASGNRRVQVGPYRLTKSLDGRQALWVDPSRGDAFGFVHCSDGRANSSPAWWSSVQFEAGWALVEED